MWKQAQQKTRDLGNTLAGKHVFKGFSQSKEEELN